MKNACPTFLTAVLLLLSSCSHAPSTHSENLEKELAGLSKLTLTQQETFRILSLISDSTNLNFPVYSSQGERLTQARIREKEMNMTVDCFGESVADIKAVVFRDLTKAELDDIFKGDEERRARQKRAMEHLKGSRAPVFSAKDVKGKVMDLKALQGKVVVLNFWFIHCSACVQEMPELNQIKQEFKESSVVFIGLTFDKEAETKAFLQHTPYDYNVIAQAQPIFDQYGIGPCPTNIVIGKNGLIVSAESGYRPYQNKGYNILTENIKKALKE